MEESIGIESYFKKSIFSWEQKSEKFDWRLTITKPVVFALIISIFVLSFKNSLTFSAYTISGLLLVTFLSTVYLCIENAHSYWKRKGVPFKQPSFLFGNFPCTLKNQKSFSEELEMLYNESTEPFLGVYALYQPLLLVRDPKLIKDIFTKEFHSFGHRAMEGNVSVDPLADNLMLQKGDRWKRTRASLSPAFTPNKLKEMFDAIVNCGKSLDKCVTKFANTNQSIEICELYARLATNMIISIAFGIDIDCIEIPESFRKIGQQNSKPTFKHIFRLAVSCFLPRLARILRIRFADKEVGGFMIQKMKQNLESREKNNICRKDFFQMLVQLRNTGEIQDGSWDTKSNNNRKAMSIEEMAAHANLFFNAGFQSTSSSMSFLTYELAKNPEIQQQVYEEMIEVLEKYDGELTYEAVTEMKYMGQCLDEILRLYSPFSANSRVCTNAYRIPGTDFEIEKGTALVFSVRGLNYDSKFYTESRKFKPERYSDEEKASKGFIERPNLAFGLGPRNCVSKLLGKLQTKIGVILLLRKFRFELDDMHKNTELKLNPTAFVLTPLNGINLKLFNRLKRISYRSFKPAILTLFMIIVTLGGNFVLKHIVASSTFPIFVIFLILLLLAIYLYIENAHLYWKRKRIPFKQPFFLSGNFPKALSSEKLFGEELEEIYRESTEPILGVYAFFQPLLLVRDPKLIKDIFTKEFHSFGHRAIYVDVKSDPLADNLLLQKGDLWKRSRASLSPAFTPNKLKEMFDVIVNCGKSLDKYVGMFANTSQSIEICEVYASFATNAIVSVAFGIDIDCVEIPDSFRKYGQQFFAPDLRNRLRGILYFFLPRLAKILKVRFADKEVGDFMINIMKQNLEFSEKNNICRKDFFQMLVQLRNTGEIQDGNWDTKSNNNRKAMTIEEITAHANLFFNAGFESTSSSMSFLTYELAKNPEIQQHAYEEIIEVLEKYDGKLTYDAVMEMKYMGQCLDENLRLYSPFPVVSRVCTKTYKIPGTDFEIEEGTSCVFSVRGLNYDSTFYADSRKFKPDRYSDEEKAGKGFIERPNLAFGDGARACIAKSLGKLQTKIGVILLLRKFRFELDDAHKNTELKLNTMTLALSPLNGIKLKVFER